MAVISEWTTEQKQEWNNWLAWRPPIVRELAERFPPTHLYRLRGSGHRVTMYSYSENGTVTVIVSGDYNRVAFKRKVFGVKPDDLEECDLPAECERLGEMLQDEESIDRLIAEWRQVKYN